MQDIDIYEIEVFLTVARCGNISRAAKKLFISQSAVSNWIFKMETDCGMTLFKRTNRGVVLTPEGEDMFSLLDVAYHRFCVSVAEICQPPGNADKVLRIGSLNRADVYACAEKYLSRFRSRFPDVEVRTEKYNYHELRNKLLCNELDLVFSVSFDISVYPEYDTIPVGKTQQYFQFPAAWLPGQAAASVDFLNGKQLILEAPTSRQYILGICSSAGIDIGSMRYVNSYIYQTVLVKRGVGFAVDSLPADTATPSGIAKIPIPQGNCDSIVCGWFRDRISPHAEKLISMLRDEPPL